MVWDQGSRSGTDRTIGRCAAITTLLTHLGEFPNGFAGSNMIHVCLYKILPEDNPSRFILAFNRPKKVKITD